MPGMQNPDRIPTPPPMRVINQQVSPAVSWAQLAIFLGDTSQTAWTWRDAVSRNDYLNLSPPKTPKKNLLYEHRFGPHSPTSNTDEYDDGDWSDCRHLPGAENILLIMKTGATEIYNRFPMHIETTLKCAPNYVLLSDLEHTISGNNIPVHDVLKFVRPQTRHDHPDFELYHTIQEYHNTGQDVRTLSASTGWDLDKWKFLPMLHYAWNLTESPNYFNSTIDWFVMIETDTALSWLNLIHFLLPLDANEPQYIGAPATFVADGTAFAHGGSGIVMSRTAVQKVEEMRRTYVEGEVDGISNEEAYDRKWETLTGQICCGDVVLSKAFMDVGVHVASARPTVQGDTRLSIRFDSLAGESAYLGRLEEKLRKKILNGGVDGTEYAGFQELPDDVDLWCQTPVTFHHVTPVEVDEFWRFQEDFVQHKNGGLWNETFKYKDVFMEFIFPSVTNHSREGEPEEAIPVNASVARQDWNNLSEQWKVEIQSPEEGGGVRFEGPSDPRMNAADKEALEYFTTQSVYSAQHCQWACERRGEPFAWPQDDPSVGECVQWKWSSLGKCHMDRRIALGEALTKADDAGQETWTSGWVEKRVRDFVKRKGDCKGPIEQMKERLKEFESGEMSAEELTSGGGGQMVGEAGSPVQS
ncbi:hypothetical protein BST61_g10387 [Cercospora zeina]